ncbi:hypothetical protein AB0M29_35465 [Streptomyces sp. NPDC051976]
MKGETTGQSDHEKRDPAGAASSNSRNGVRSGRELTDFGPVVE